ncbi:MAG: class I SAM-dependent methyltransferase [Bacteroidales bacterium]|jgi:ubiquinone/menaquinone biosynthesis C-methylase UbiE|nr:class I SAM-dependent methyltransferase [Bacteroidales bacterium]
MKSTLSNFIRNLGLIKFVDKLNFYIVLFKTRKQRNEFKKSHPDVALPPPFYMYETFGLNYESFYNKSESTAKWLISYFQKYSDLKNIKILDWGCGPGRVIRHLSVIMDPSCEFHGSDYNKKYIDWCSKNIINVTFKTNQLIPPLNYEENTFDIIYGISIFTHLSEEMHHAWFCELMRVLKHGGILILTLHGDAFKEKLTKSERDDFEKGKLIVKSNTKEGHRTYTAFQPTSFVEKLVANNKILEHVCGSTKNGKIEQDLWVIKKS